MQDRSTKLFLGVDTHGSGARVVASPTATCWQIIPVEKEGVRGPTAFRCVRCGGVLLQIPVWHLEWSLDPYRTRGRLVLGKEGPCVIIDSQGVPQLGATNDDRGEGEFWYFEEMESHQGVEFEMTERDGHGTTGMVCFLLGLSSA